MKFTEEQKEELRKAFHQEHWLVTEIKDLIFFIVILLILSLIFSFSGIEGGRGGNPQNSYQEEYYINDSWE